MAAALLLDLVPWWTAIGLNAVLLTRSLQTRLWHRYPFFYCYIGWVLALSLIRLYVSSSRGDIYPQFYWDTQDLSVIVGYGVILESYRGVLRNYPGAQKIARTILLALLAIIILKAYVHPLGKATNSLLRSAAEIERDMRTAQGLLLAGLLLIVLYYIIPIGINLGGIISGYAFFVGTNVINLALRSSLGDRFQTAWRYLQSVSYIVAALVWCITLWSPRPDPERETFALVERDYGLLASKISSALARVRGYVVRAFGK